MKTYKIELQPVGGITQLPDSQKIFGALVYLYAQNQSEQEATKFAQNIREENIYLSISNVVPRGYFPTPKVELLDRLADKGISDKANYKAIKKRDYIGEENLKPLLKDPSRGNDTYPYVYTEQFQQQRASVLSSQYNISGLQNALYSISEINLLEIKSKAEEENEVRNCIKDFCFYLHLDKSEECNKLIAILQNSKEKNNVFVLGPRASQGLNRFKVTNIAEYSLQRNEEVNYFLNMGMLLPNQINYDKSALKLFTSERCPYEAIGSWEKENMRKFISFIEEGSTIVTSGDYKQAGHCIKSEYNSQAILFGNSFLFPISSK